MPHNAPYSPARDAAVDQLNRIEVGGAYIDNVELLSEEEDPRDERLAMELVAGVTRQRRWLDFILSDFYRGDYDGMEPLLRQILRIGLYELLFLDTPPYAVINEAVELAKSKVRPGAAGLVNGILRNVLRRQESDDMPSPETGERARDMAVRYSHPTWIVRRWLQRYGPDETEALLQWNNRRPHFGVRVNRLRLGREEFEERLNEVEIDWSSSPYLEDFYRLRQLQPVIRGGWLGDGVCAVQDESAGLVVRLLDPEPGEFVIDGCAAPGGKSTFASARMQNRGRILAFDVDPRRLRLVQQGAQDQDISIIETREADLRSFAEESELRADRVLVDVPCTGLGVLGKRADLRWRRRADDLGQLAELQGALLRAAARLVRPGGVLVYSTCTIEPEENEQVVAAFLRDQSDFALEPASNWLPDDVTTAEGYYATFPPRHETDGAFGARMRRQEATGRNAERA